MDIVYTTRMLLMAQTICNHLQGERHERHAIYCAPGLMNRMRIGLSGVFLLYIWLFGVAPLSMAQTAGSEAAKQAIALGQKGKCREALPMLKRSMPQTSDKQLEYETAMMTARCAMSLDQTETAVRALLLLNREFPHDPEVLFTTTHFYSELASRASQELAATAPNSAQAQQLEAEAFESQGNWEKATAQYQEILKQNPQAPGVHYRLGRIFLSKNPSEPENAKKEFEQELKVDPSNASAEFMLGETARQAGQWDDAIAHFSRASQLDEGFLEAYLGLGMSLNSAQKFSEAVAPLEKYVKLEPADPAGHYQLATAYARSGRKQDAEREMTLQREAAAKNPQQVH